MSAEGNASKTQGEPRRTLENCHEHERHEVMGGRAWVSDGQWREKFRILPFICLLVSNILSNCHFNYIGKR